MEKMEATSKDGHSLGGRSSLAKARALRGVSGAALERSLARVAIPAVVLFGSLALVDGQLGAMNISHQLDASAHAIGNLAAPKVGTPVVRVRFDADVPQPVAPQQHDSASGRHRTDGELAFLSTSISRPFPALEHYSYAIRDMLEEVGRTSGGDTSTFTNFILQNGAKTKNMILAPLAHLSGSLPDAKLFETPRLVVAFMNQMLERPLRLAERADMASIAREEEPGAPLSDLADPVQEYADRRRDPAARFAAQFHVAVSNPGLGEPFEVAWSKLAAVVADLDHSVLTAFYESAHPVSGDFGPFVRVDGVVAEPMGAEDKAGDASLAPPYAHSIRAKPPATTFASAKEPVSSSRNGDVSDIWGSLADSAPESGAASWTPALGEPAAYSSIAIRPSDLVGSVDNEHGITWIRMRALVDMLQDRLSEAERRRLMRTTDWDFYIPNDQLQDAVISAFFDPGANALTLQLASAQSVEETGGGAAASGSRSSKTMDVSASAGFDSNPFLSARPDPEVASLRLQLTPRFERDNGRSSIRAAGRFEHIEYLGRYRSLQNYGADFAGVHRLNERLEMNAGALFRSDILATDLTNPLLGSGSVDPGIPTIPGGNDVTLLGQAERRNQFGGDAGLRWTPSNRDEFRLSSSFRSDRFESGDLSDSDFYSQQLRYTRQISDTLNLGAVVDGSIINFSGAGFGDTKTITPQALVVAKLGNRLTASASFGVAISQVDLAAGEQTNTAFAGNLSLCREGIRSSLCVTGARQVLPSAIGGARVQTTGGLSYSLRLSERDSLQLGGNYSTASAPLAGAGGDFESINAFAGYERQLNERMRLQARAGYLDTSGQAAIEATNFQALVGISVTFGRVR